MILALLAHAVTVQVATPYGSPMDRDHALGYVERIAREEGLPPVVEVRSFTSAAVTESGAKSTPGWSFELRLEGNDRMQGEVTSVGTIQRMFLADKTMPQTPNVGEPMQNQALVAEAWRLLKPMRPQGDVRLDDIEYSSLGFEAEFSVRVSGHRFFNLNPTYGYRLWFDPRNNSLLQYFNAETPTAVNAAKPRVTEESAEGKLTGLCRELGAGLFDPNWPVPVRLRMELGYFKFQKEAPARLVWRGYAVQTLPDGREIESGATSHFVDGLTGEVIKSDDAGMGGIDVGEPKRRLAP